MTTSLDRPPAPPAPAPRRAWYRRPTVIGTFVIAVIIGITVVTDLPTRQTRSSDIGTAQAILNEVEQDVAPCSYAMGEAFGFYKDVATHSITPAHRAETPSLLRDDLIACSYTTQGITDLASINVPGDASGRLLTNVVGDALTWCEPDSFLTIAEIEKVLGRPGAPASLPPALAKDERTLGAARALVERDMARLEARLHTTDLPKISLVKAP